MNQKNDRKSLYTLSVKARTKIKREFLKKVRKTKSCWIWKGRISKPGYGVIFLGNKFTDRTARVSYELFVKEIPKGLIIDHLCRNRKCVNPKHLETVTYKENILRGIGCCAKHARKTRCIHGHKFTKENTYIPKGGGRCCRICKKLRNREYRLRIRT